MLIHVRCIVTWIPVSALLCVAGGVCARVVWHLIRAVFVWVRSHAVAHHADAAHTACFFGATCLVVFMTVIVVFLTACAVPLSG
jgi:hypothetical protein